MKKILIALPLVLVMLLSMVPVMAAQKSADVTADYFSDKYKNTTVTTETFKAQVDTDMTKAEREAAVEEVVKNRAFPAVNGKAGDQYEWVIVAQETTEYLPKGTKVLTGTPQTAAAMSYADFGTLAGDLGITVALTGTADTNIKKSALEKLQAAVDADPQQDQIIIDGAKDTDATGDTFDKAYSGTVLTDDQSPVYAVEAYPLSEKPTEAPTTEAPTTEAPTTEAPTTEAPTTEAPTTEEPTEAPTTEKITCPEACEFITVELRDVFSGRNLAGASKQFKVNNKVAPDFDAILDLYLDQYFPWRDWQPVKNYLNVYSIITPKDIYDCKIIIEVIPRWEYIMVIHELWDCCITPDGKVKEELSRSFIEDNQKYESWNPAYFSPNTGETVLGLPDGVLPIDFLDFHTDLKVNQEKAAEYAKNRLEKMNAADFVFQHATFYENVRVSNYFTGDVYDMNGNKITTWTNGIPTIVIKYLRAECIKTDEKVDDAKVVAGQAGTTSTPVQQLPATGAKDVTAFFMSAVALLGLGIFFAKKR